MPNWCSNDLTVEVIRNNKASKNQLQQFVEDVCDKGTVFNEKEAKEFRKKYLAENLEKEYCEDVELYIKHKRMPITKFWTDVLNFTYLSKKKQFAKDRSDFSMEKMLPCPPELTKVTCPVRAENGETEKEFKERVKRHQKLYGASDWYEWNCANWGTKWDACDVSMGEISDTKVSYFFLTAYSPINTFLATKGIRYSLLKFSLSYEESEANFAGEFVVEAGEITEYREGECPEMCSCCGEEIEEGEESSDDGECPRCVEDNEDDDEED
jgi:hypothetical protein